MGRRSASDGTVLTLLMFQILLALSKGERHGYAIMQEIEERSAGAFGIGAGSLYRSLKALVDAGLIAEGKPRPEVHRQRRYYRLTVLGRKRLAVEARLFDRILEWAREEQILDPTPS